jgi:hypothetical protein
LGAVVPPQGGVHLPEAVQVRNVRSLSAVAEHQNVAEADLLGQVQVELFGIAKTVVTRAERGVSRYELSGRPIRAPGHAV